MEHNETLAAYRKKHHLTQEHLAEYLNVSRQTISKWETGQCNPNIDDLIKLSNLYNISVDTLVNNHPIDNSAVITKKIQI